MCTPLAATAASIGFGALSTGASYMSASSDAKATAKYNQQVVDANAKQANEAYAFNTQQEQTRMIQEETSKTLDTQNIELEKRRASGEALASSNGAAVNLEYLLGDLERQKDRQIAPLNQQWEWKKQQSRNNMKGYQAQADGRIASVNPSPVSQPSLVGAVAGFAADATGTYMKYRKMKGETK